MLWILALLPAQACAREDLQPPQKVIQQMSEEARAVVRAEGDRLVRERERLHYWVEQIIFPRVDFEVMSRYVLGKSWRRAEPEQREEFVREFRILLLSTYAAAYEQFGDWQVRFMPFEADSTRKTVVVRTRIELAGGPAGKVDFRMRQAGEHWKIFDVAIEGVSLVANFRTTFAHEVRKGGIDGLLRKMQTHNVREVAEGAG
jgi:phospholipid transport system substrate-binding protein